MRVSSFQVVPDTSMTAQSRSPGKSVLLKMHPNILMKPPMAEPGSGEAGHGQTQHVAQWKSFGTATGSSQPQQGQLCNKSWSPPWPAPTAASAHTSAQIWIP